MMVSHDQIFHWQCNELATLKSVTHSVELSHDDDSKLFFLPTIFIIGPQKSTLTANRHSNDNVLTLCRVSRQWTDSLPSKTVCCWHCIHTDCVLSCFCQTFAVGTLSLYTRQRQWKGKRCMRALLIIKS